MLVGLGPQRLVQAFRQPDGDNLGSSWGGSARASHFRSLVNIR